MGDFYRLEYAADKGDNDKWGVVDKRGGIAYDYSFDTQDEADFIADYHNRHPRAEYERDVLPAWEAYTKVKLAPADESPQRGVAGAGDVYGYSELLDELNGRIKGLERELAAANRLLDDIERNMPTKQPEERHHSNNSKAYSAWIAGEKIRAYKAAKQAQAATGDQAAK